MGSRILRVHAAGQRSLDELTRKRKRKATAKGRVRTYRKATAKGRVCTYRSWGIQSGVWSQRGLSAGLPASTATS